MESYYQGCLKYKYRLYRYCFIHPKKILPVLIWCMGQICVVIGRKWMAGHSGYLASKSSCYLRRVGSSRYTIPPSAIMWILVTLLRGDVDFEFRQQSVESHLQVWYCNSDNHLCSFVLMLCNNNQNIMESPGTWVHCRANHEVWLSVVTLCWTYPLFMRRK